MPRSRPFLVNSPASPAEYESLHQFASRTPSPVTTPEGDVAQPRKKGWLGDLKARVRAKLPKSDETELATLLSDHKRAGSSLNTIADYTPPTRGALTVTPESTPQVSAHGTPPTAQQGTPPGTIAPDAGDAARAARSQRKMTSMMRRAQHGVQRLRERGNTPAAAAPAQRAPVTVPGDAEGFRQVASQLFHATGNAAERDALIERLGRIGAPADDAAPMPGRYTRPMLAARALAATCGGNAADALVVLRHLEHTVRFDPATFGAALTEPGSAHSTHASEFSLNRLFEQESEPALSRHASSSDLGLDRLFEQEGEPTLSRNSSSSNLGLNHLFGQADEQALSCSASHSDNDAHSTHPSELSLNRLVEQASTLALSRNSSLSAQYGSEASSGGTPPAPVALRFDAASALGAAWRTAQLLSRTHNGFETLRGLMQSPPTGEITRTARAFLQAADHLSAGAAASSEPTALLRDHPPGSGTRTDSLAISVLHAAAAKLRRDAPVSAQDSGALFAWHQGFREDGPGSDLANTKARLAKFVGRSIPRVEKQGARAHFWQMVGKKKSPLSAAALGMHGAHRAGLVKELASYTQAMHTLIGALATSAEAPAPQAIAHPGDLWRAAILQHWNGLAAAGAPLSDYALTAQTLRTLQPQVGAAVSRMERAMAEPAAIARSAGSVSAQGEFAQLVSQAGLADDPQSRAWARDRLGRLATPQMTSAQARFAELVSHAGLVGEPPAYLVGLQPSAALLRYWSGYVSEAAASPGFQQALEKADKIERQDDLKLQAPTIEGARQTIETLLSSMESGNKVRLANGGWIGVSTTGVSTGLSHVGKALPVPVSVQLDANLGTSRQAVVEVGRSSHGRDLFLGTDRTVRGSLGVGASVGYDIKIKGLGTRLRAAFGMKVTPIDIETGEPRGVMIRATRPTTRPVEGIDDWEAVKYDDKAAQQAQIAAANLLFEHAAASREHRPDADALWNALAQHCGDSDAISVGWVDQTKRRTRVSAEVNGGANIRVSGKNEPFRIGPSVRLRGEKTVSNTAALHESTGTLRVEQFSISTGHKVTVRAGLGFTAGKTFFTSAPSDNASAKSGEGGKITQSFTGGTPIGHSWKLGEGGHTAKVKMAYRDGRIADRVCYFDTEYRSAKEYLAVARSERDAWIEMLANKPGGALAEAAREFDAYCETVEKHARPNQRYLHRQRLRPAVAREIEGHLDLADMHRSIAPDAADAHASEALAEALLHAPESRLPEKLAIVEQVSSSNSLGLSAAIQMRSHSEVEGQRELAAIKFG